MSLICSLSTRRVFMALSSSTNHNNRESSSTPRTWRYQLSRFRDDAYVSSRPQQLETVAVSGAQSAGDRADVAGSLQLATRQVLAARAWRLWNDVVPYLLRIAETGHLLHQRSSSFVRPYSIRHRVKRSNFHGCVKLLSPSSSNMFMLNGFVVLGRTTKCYQV